MSDVLIIIDVQKAILDGTFRPEREAEVRGCFDQMVSRLAGLRERAHRAGAPVILIRHDGSPGDRLEKGSAGWELVEALSPAGGDIVMAKESCDSFHETELSARLAQLGATRLIIGGCMSQYCVDTTVRRAISDGFDVTLIADGHCTGDSPVLRQDQIIAHHNQLLDGFDAGAHAVRVAAAADIRF